MNTQPNIAVGIIHHPTLLFSLNGAFELTQNGYSYEADQYAEVANGKILYNGDYYDEIDLVPHPNGKPCSFILKELTPDADLNWQQGERQNFKGILRLIVSNNELQVVNILPLEEYLKSVISSDIPATNEEILKTHAVISRSWVFAKMAEHQIEGWHKGEHYPLFDVCADIHCQRYPGISDSANPLVEKAIEQTFGELLINDKGEICHARFFDKDGLCKIDATEMSSKGYNYHHILAHYFINSTLEKVYEK